LTLDEFTEKEIARPYGTKHLGTLSLESIKGSLLISVNPSPAKVILKRNTETLGQGDAPFTVGKLPVGNYTLFVQRGEHKETHSVKIEGKALTTAQIDLNLGSVSLSSDPEDAEFALSGNARHWEGKLPMRIDDIPVGKYSLITRRKGWELKKDILVSRGSSVTNETEFQYGSIDVTSDPVGLMISTNGTAIGKTPTVLAELKPGRYTLVATDGENDLSAIITVESKQSVKHAFSFHYGAVRLSSIPTGAAVSWKNKRIS